MDNNQKFDKNGRSTKRATFDKQSDQVDVDSRNDLNQCRRYLYQNVFQRPPNIPEAGYNEMLDPKYMENLLKRFPQAIEEFEREPQEGIQLPPFRELRNPSRRALCVALSRCQDEPSMASCSSSHPGLNQQRIENAEYGVAGCSSSNPDFSKQLVDNAEYGVASCSSSNPNFSPLLASNADPGVAGCSSSSHDFNLQQTVRSQSSLDQVQQSIPPPAQEGLAELTGEERKKVLKLRERRLTLDPGVAGCSSSSHDFNLQQTVRSQRSLDQAQQSIPPPAQEGLAELTGEERKTVLKLRERRLTLGKKQIDLIPELSKLSGVRFRVSWLSDFENFRLGPLMMRHLIPFFKQCLQNIEKSRKAEEHQLSYELNRE